MDDVARESDEANRAFTRLSVSAGPATVGIASIGSAAALAVGPVLTLGAAVSALTTATLGIVALLPRSVVCSVSSLEVELWPLIKPGGSAPKLNR